MTPPQTQGCSAHVRMSHLHLSEKKHALEFNPLHIWQDRIDAYSLAHLYSGRLYHRTTCSSKQKWFCWIIKTSSSFVKSSQVIRNIHQLEFHSCVRISKTVVPVCSHFIGRVRILAPSSDMLLPVLARVWAKDKSPEFGIVEEILFFSSPQPLPDPHLC